MEKEDYYYDGCDLLDAGDKKGAIKLFKKALEIDEMYVEAYNGLGTAYWNNIGFAMPYFKKAYDLTKKKFKDWPKELPWGILENRQYLRAIHCYGLCL